MSGWSNGEKELSQIRPGVEWIYFLYEDGGSG